MSTFSINAALNLKLGYGVDVTHVSAFSPPLQGVRMGETATNVAALNSNQAIKINVKEGCDVENPCDSNPCPLHSYCSDDWDSYSCVCDPGNVFK